MVTAYAGSAFGGCNVGFVGHKNGEDYLVTALHCVGPETQVGDVIRAGGNDFGEVTHVPDRSPSFVPGIDYTMDGDYVVVKLFDSVEATDEVDQIPGGRMLTPAYSPSRGEELVKEGDTTGVTSGRCVATDTTIISPGSLSKLGGTIELKNQVAVSTSVWPGDSGGPIMKPNGSAEYYPVGVLHGGVPEFSMVGTRITHIEDVTGVNFGVPAESAEPDPDPPDDDQPDDGDDGSGGRPPLNRSRLLGAGLTVGFGSTAVYLG